MNDEQHTSDQVEKKENFDQKVVVDGTDVFFRVEPDGGRKFALTDDLTAKMQDQEFEKRVRSEISRAAIDNKQGFDRNRERDTEFRKMQEELAETRRVLAEMNGKITTPVQQKSEDTMDFAAFLKKEGVTVDAYSEMKSGRRDYLKMLYEDARRTPAPTATMTQTHSPEYSTISEKLLDVQLAQQGLNAQEVRDYAKWLNAPISEAVVESFRRQQPKTAAQILGVKVDSVSGLPAGGSPPQTVQKTDDPITDLLVSRLAKATHKAK